MSTETTDLSADDVASIGADAALAEARSIANRYGSQYNLVDYAREFQLLQEKISDDFRPRYRQLLLRYLGFARRVVLDRYGSKAMDFVAYNGSADGLDNLPRSTAEELRPTPFVQRIETEAKASMAELCGLVKTLASDADLESIFAGSAIVDENPAATAAVARFKAPAVIASLGLTFWMAYAILMRLNGWRDGELTISTGILAFLPALCATLGLAGGLLLGDSESSGINDLLTRTRLGLLGIGGGISALAGALTFVSAADPTLADSPSGASIGLVALLAAVTCVVTSASALLLTLVFNSPHLLAAAIRLNSRNSRWKAERRLNEATRARDALIEVHRTSIDLVAQGARALALLYYDANLYARRNSRNEPLEEFIEAQRLVIEEWDIACVCDVLHPPPDLSRR